MSPQAVATDAGPGSVAHLEPLLRELVPLNRTTVSDDMDRAAALLDRAMGTRAVRYHYPSGQEYGSWVVPPSWNVREAFLADGERILASYQDHVLFLAPYSAAFEGWVSREELLRHVNVSQTFDDAFVYQHRLASDFQRRLREWQISLPRRLVAALSEERYFVKIDVDVRPGAMTVLEYAVEGPEDTTVALLGHLCHPGQANDGLSGVLAGMALLQRLAEQPHRLTYKLLVMPETIGSVIHVIAQGLSPGKLACTVFLETMGGGERLFLKKSRRGDGPIDLAINSLARERPGLGVLNFFDGYGNDELMFDFANVGIPSAGVQHYPFADYHTSRDAADRIDWDKWRVAVDVTQELLRRLEANRVIQLKHPGPPYLSRYRLYADAVTERTRFEQNTKLLALCDGTHSVLEMCEVTGLAFEEIMRFFSALEREGLLLTQ